MRRLAIVAVMLGGCDKSEGPTDDTAAASSSESTGTAEESEGSSSSSDGYPMVDCIAEGCECAERGHCQMACNTALDCPPAPWPNHCADSPESCEIWPTPIPCIDGFCQWNPYGCADDGYCRSCAGPDNDHNGWCAE